MPGTSALPPCPPSFLRREAAFFLCRSRQQFPERCAWLPRRSARSGPPEACFLLLTATKKRFFVHLRFQDARGADLPALPPRPPSLPRRAAASLGREVSFSVTHPESRLPPEACIMLFSATHPESRQPGEDLFMLFLRTSVPMMEKYITNLCHFAHSQSLPLVIKWRRMAQRIHPHPKKTPRNALTFQSVSPDKEVTAQRHHPSGEGEIRTLEPFYRLHDFQSCALDQARRLLHIASIARQHWLFYHGMGGASSTKFNLFFPFLRFPPAARLDGGGGME